MSTVRHSFSEILSGAAAGYGRCAHQAIGKVPALAVFASDALSSVAYATEEILVILALAGAGLLLPLDSHCTRYLACCWSC